MKQYISFFAAMIVCLASNHARSDEISIDRLVDCAADGLVQWAFSQKARDSGEDVSYDYVKNVQKGAGLFRQGAVLKSIEEMNVMNAGELYDQVDEISSIVDKKIEKRVDEKTKSLKIMVQKFGIVGTLNKLDARIVECSEEIAAGTSQ